MDLSSFYSDLERRQEKEKEQPKHTNIITRARKEIEIADHLMFVTFPLVSDIKFLLSITEHVISSSKLALEALLEYERYYKRIEPFPNNFAVMLNAFKTKVYERYQFEDKHLRLLNKLLDLSHFIEKSQMQFRRQEKFILTADPYDIKTLDKETVKRQLGIAKDFIERVEEITRDE